MFICVSNVVFRAVSSGKAVRAAFKLAVLDDVSLNQNRRSVGFCSEAPNDVYICEISLISLTPVERVSSAASCLYRFNSASMSSAT